MSPEPFRILRVIFWILAAFCGLVLAATFAAGALDMPAAATLKVLMPFSVCGLALSIVGMLINERIMRIAYPPDGGGRHGK